MTPMEQEGFLPETKHDNGPCHPDSQCLECADYWQRMIAEGYWDQERSRWTDKGWTDILRHA